MKKILSVLTVQLLLCLAAASISAQDGYEIKGVVQDALGPVIGVTLMEQGTTNGTSTGLDGDFTLTVSGPDAMVEVSCIGYKTQIFKASELPPVITVTEDALFLDYVVVIVYGTVKYVDMTVSVWAII